MQPQNEDAELILMNSQTCQTSQMHCASGRRAKKCSSAKTLTLAISGILNLARAVDQVHIAAYMLTMEVA